MKEQHAEVVAVREPSTLTEQELIDAIKSSMSLSVAAAIKAGELLLEAKKRHGKHGRWIDYLTVKLNLTERTAQRHMRLAKLAKNDKVSFLKAESVSAALRMADGQWTKQTFYCCPRCNWNGLRRVVKRLELPGGNLERPDCSAEVPMDGAVAG